MIQNPYQPPRPLDAGSHPGSEIVVRGEVTLDDVAKLIDAPKILLVAQVASIAAVVVCLIGTVFVVVVSDDWLASAVVMALLCAVSAILMTCVYLLGRRSRAKRFVKRTPGILGPINAYLDDFGIGFRVETTGEMQQISWATFSDVEVMRGGVRLAWGGSNPSMIVLPALAFDDFESVAMDSLIKQLRYESDGIAVAQVVPDWSSMPTGAMRYHSYAALNPPLSRRDSIKLVIVNSLSGIALIAGCVGLAVWGEILAVGGVFLLLGALQMVAIPLNKRATPDSYVLGDWGWLTPEGSTRHMPHAVYEVRWLDAKELQINDDFFLAQFADGTGVYATPTNLIDGDWALLTTWIEAVQAPASV